MTEYTFYWWDENGYCSSSSGEWENDKEAIKFAVSGDNEHGEVWREGIGGCRYMIASW